MVTCILGRSTGIHVHVLYVCMYVAKHVSILPLILAVPALTCMCSTQLVSYPDSLGYDKKQKLVQKATEKQRGGATTYAGNTPSLACVCTSPSPLDSYRACMLHAC